MTPKEDALRANEIVRECLEACDGEVDAGLDAAEILLTHTTEELKQLEEHRTWVDGYGISHDADGAALSLEENERVEKSWVDEFGITHSVSVPLSHQEQRGLNRSRLRPILDTLEAALAQMAPQREAIALALEETDPLDLALAMDSLNNAKALPYAGWYSLPNGPWSKVCTARTEDECWDKMEEFVEAKGGGQCRAAIVRV